MMRILVVTSVCVTLMGCGSNIDDLIVYTQQVKANTQISIEPYPEFAALPSVSYEASNLRSPFRRSITNASQQAQAIEKPDCKQLNQNRRQQPLEQYGLDALEMSGVFTSNGRKYALIKANDGSLHKITTGAYIGLFHGRVKQIKNQQILITEMLPDGAGCYKSKEATLSMSPMVGENNDV
ncbi:MAG: pilus assembly protein PilP [Glaciecola sp.]